MCFASIISSVHPRDCAKNVDDFLVFVWNGVRWNEKLLDFAHDLDPVFV